MIMDLHVVNIEITTVNLPFREIPARNMIREIPHWTIFEVCKVTLHGGTVGWGESMQFYTWGRTTEEAVRRAWGKNAADLMWDDSLGAGLQIALFDAVAKAAGVSVHALLGKQVRDRVPLSWWNIDMSPADWAAECKTMLAAGYTDFKSKGRPWWDNDAQLEAIAKVVPEGFKVDLDYNEMLLDAEHAVRVLPRVEKECPFVAIYESPIPQADVEGGKKVQAMTKVDIAYHYGSPAIATTLKEDVCDGFVVGGGASRVMEQGHLCAEVKKPFWLQLVGSGITAAFSRHLGAVLEQAVWPAVNCHQLYRGNALLTKPIRVKDGTSAVPDAPGLGVEIDEDAIKRYRIEPLEDKPPGPKRLVKVEWSGGRRIYFTHGQRCFEDGHAGKMPFFERGVTTTVIRDDGSAEFRDLHARASKDPIYEGF